MDLIYSTTKGLWHQETTEHSCSPKQYEQNWLFCVSTEASELLTSMEEDIHHYRVKQQLL